MKPKLFESSGVRCSANFEVTLILAAQLGLAVATRAEAGKALFSGEPCAARIHAAYYFCHDGIVSSIPLLKTVEDGKSHSESISEVPMHPTPRKNIPCGNDAKFIVEDLGRTLKELFSKCRDPPAIDSTRLTLKSGLINASGTEPLITLTCEAEPISIAREIMEESIRLVRGRIGEKRK